ncbi:ATP-binding protein [Dactylosporangium salmoneum]|uniref:IstB-like ATP-binding domain-containing protein n=1 Tax=Dactylosporangium salmoneum TaxID=53361 RepID=A0ABN3G8Z1_9ACTN
MLRDTSLHATIQRVCAERGIQPAERLPWEPLTRRAFQTEQLAAVIHERWAGRYDHAQPEPRVNTWIGQHLANPTGHPALFLSGTTGSGKTHQAVAAARVIASSRFGGPYTWAATTHPDLGDELRPRSDDSHEHALDRYLNADLLLLDDLGAGMTTPWMTDCVQRLVDRRWTRRMATIYTTNLPPDQLRAAVGDRVYSRLGDTTRVTLTGTDRRWTA